eukprot:TRINITY_DN13320_c0_g6_i1.p1 TRINITY_DN13320_c0_g6~~TRINITY_DN13320_c0_g6_i1.p1  ORF type:complete len:298 (+),score=48.87 TRINITY_DN13320_c0_g6_i1:69-962(+)
MACIVALILLALNSQAKPLITRDFAESLRSQVTWEVESYENNIFKHWTEEEFKAFSCSDFIPPREVMNHDADGNDLPANFSAKQKWPKCIHPIRKQARCGSCWAFATAEALSDRFCIAGKDVLLSPQDLVSCDKSNHACNGGYVPFAMKHAERVGLLTEECFPYVSGEKGYVPPCPKGRCPSKKGRFRRYRCEVGSTRILKRRAEMKEEIMNHGPVATRFNHYADFNNYRGGIYYHRTGEYICGHYMKPIGWGVENGVNYWTLANTYGTEWGEGGYVRVKMGNSAVDDFMSFCQPDL